MKVETFLAAVERELGTQFFTGVPDSLLRPLTDYLITTYGTESAHHVIGANEGNCAGLAAGAFLATGKVPLVYLQNSGIGNLVNPVCSLLSEDVYGIPCLFVVGWRGEPGIQDEPQHKFQGQISVALLETVGITVSIFRKDTTEQELAPVLRGFREIFARGGQAALLCEKGALSYPLHPYANEASLRREEALRLVIELAGDDFFVATTGKAGRELFELREQRGESHEHDFLTIGSMGHASSLALGAALAQPEKRFWIFDGDGAALMHLGALPVIGKAQPQNVVHVVFNNGAHESVGGQPTAARYGEFSQIARAAGYPAVYCADSAESLQESVKEICARPWELTFLEVATAIGARADLGRPTTSPKENRDMFCRAIRG